MKFNASINNKVNIQLYKNAQNSTWYIGKEIIF